MALPNSNISVTLVKTELGSIDNNVSGLCMASKINKWSKFKPVRGTYPQASDGKYGYDLNNLWNYLRPNGGTNPYRLGDFRQYEHNQAETLPPIYVKFTSTSFASNNGKNDAVNYPNVSGQIMLNDNGVANTTEITLADMGLQNYYFGVAVMQPSHGYAYYKTLGSVVSNAQVFSFNPFTDLPIPLYDDGTEKYILFILSSEIKSSWGSVAPIIYYRLPHETVNGFVITSKENLVFSLWMLGNGLNSATIPQFPNSGYAEYQSGQIPSGIAITTNINEVTDPSTLGFRIISQPSWIDARIWDDTNNRLAVTPRYGNQYNLVLRAVPNSINTGTNRFGTITLGGSDNLPLLSVSVSQLGGPPQAYIFDCPNGDVNIYDHTATIESGRIRVIFKPEINTPINTPCYMTVKRVSDNATVCFDDSRVMRGGVETSHLLTIISGLQNGETYNVYISSAGECISI